MKEILQNLFFSRRLSNAIIADEPHRMQYRIHYRMQCRIHYRIHNAATSSIEIKPRLMTSANIKSRTDEADAARLEAMIPYRSFPGTSDDIRCNP